MRGGRLRHRVIIQTPTEVNDSRGQAIKTWATFATVYAAVEPISGREYFDAAQINAEITTKIIIRSLPGVTQKMRVSYDSRLYNIQSIININERDREMHLFCSEGLNNG